MTDAHDHHHRHHDDLWRRDADLSRAVDHGKAQLEILFDCRAEVWAGLVAEGIEQKEIAERAGVDPSDVSRALSSRGL